MKKIVFISNVDIGEGMSGGTTIYLNFLKNWTKIHKVFFGSKGSIKRLMHENIEDITFVETDKTDQADLFSFWGIFRHSLRRLIKGVGSARKNIDLIKEADYIYSVSDFFPDFFPAFYAKLKHKKIIWIAGFYLFAPTPFSRHYPYKGINIIRGFAYWLMQQPAHFVIKHFADFVFVTSEPDVKKFITIKRKEDKIIAVQGGVDIMESEKYFASEIAIPLPKRKYDACFVGRFHWQKGVLELVDIWDKVRRIEKDAKLAMVGNGSLEEEVKKRIKILKLDGNIDLLGYRNGQEKYEIFKQSKIIVHPAIYDSGGMAAAEGMAWGLPGVSFDIEALKTYYVKGMLKTEVGNNQEFAENILRLLNNQELYEKISSDAHDLIVDVWDWKKRADKIYGKIIRNE